MKKILAIFSLAALLMPVSCVKDNLESYENGSITGKGMKFTAVMEKSASKTTLGEGGSVAWESGDLLKFDFETEKKDCEPVTSDPLETIEGGMATFSADVPAVFAMSVEDYNAAIEKYNATIEDDTQKVTASRHLYASYPADLVTEYYGSGSYLLTIPTEQKGTFASASIAIAKWNIQEPTSPLKFYNLCGLLQIKIDDANARKIRLTSSTVLAGKMDVGFPDETYDYPRVKKVSDGSNSIDVNVNGPGTYYVAVAVFYDKDSEEYYTEINDLHVELFDENGNCFGDKTAKSSLKVYRSHVLPLGILENDGEGGYFVKSKACGAKDGSSWDNAADYTALHALLDNDLNGKTAEDARTMTVYMAAGTHSASKQLNVTPAHNVKIYGGYPADAKGVSLSGRDVVANATIIEGGESYKIWNLTAGVWEISGLQFQNAKTTDGSAITIKNNIVITCSDCTFKNNVATTTGAGAVFFYGLGAKADVLFENCSFIGNKATKADGNANTGLGGAVGSANAFNDAVVKFNKCLFENNEAARNGGAMWFRTVSARITDCNFINNKAGVVADEAITNGYGTQIFVDGSNLLQVYFDGCYFTQNTIDLNSMIHTNNSSAESCLALNNSVVAGAWGAGGKVSVYNGGKGKLLVSSSTLFGQMGGIVKSTSTGSVSVINSIVPHTATTGMSNSFLNNGTGTFTVKKSLYSLVKADQTFVEEGNLAEIYVNSASEERNFPVSDDYVWYKGASNSQRENNRTTTALVEDVRGTVHYYAWDGAYPEGAEFTNATLEQVTQMVKDADAGFATWLGDRLGKDIRGNSRNDQSMWPGSYQE